MLELPDIPPHPKVPLKTLDNASRDGRTQLEGKKSHDLLMGYDLRPIDSWGSDVCAAIWKVSTDIYCNRSRAYRLLKDWASTLEHDFPWHRLGMLEYDDTRVEQETGYSPEWIAELGEVELCLVEDTAKLESWVTDNKQRIVTWVAAVKKALDAAYMSLDDVPLAAKGFMLTYHLCWLELDKIVCQLDELCTAIVSGLDCGAPFASLAVLQT